jgi:hypothetical protein
VVWLLFADIGREKGLGFRWEIPPPLPGMPAGALSSFGVSEIRASVVSISAELWQRRSVVDTLELKIPLRDYRAPQKKSPASLRGLKFQPLS